jgi:hypothetical protein
VFDNIETRMVRKSVLPRKANRIMSVGPSNQWKSVDF